MHIPSSIESSCLSFRPKKKKYYKDITSLNEIHDTNQYHYNYFIHINT